MHSAKLIRSTLVLVSITACSSAPSATPSPAPSDAGTKTADASSPVGSPPPSSFGDAAAPDVPPCEDSSFTLKPLADAQFGPDFASSYKGFDLGQIPGVPNSVGKPYGGLYVRVEEPNLLYVIGEAEDPGAALYRIGVQRDACKHIVGFVGQAEKVGGTPYADANILSTPSGWLYSIFPAAKIGHLSSGGQVLESDLKPLGLRGPFIPNLNDQFPGESPGGLAVVPSNLAGAGKLVAIAYPTGDVFHLTISTTGGQIAVTEAQKRESALPNGPGAFAYVPSGSPGFAKASLIVTEFFQGPVWKSAYDNPQDGAPQAVGAYEVTADGIPIPSSRRPFFAQFPRPWGAFFEPLTGDFLFATWRGYFGSQPDRIVQVRGFSVPPPPAVPK